MTVVHKDPDCSCFREPESMRARMSHFVVTRTAQQIGLMMEQSAVTCGLCNRALPLMMEDSIISMATIIATKGTAIELGSQEAQWETRRVLEGIEARLISRLDAYYEKLARLMAAEREGKSC